ncbi:tyrosine-type recombinase/integrase [Ciceribacter selenitireducens]
MSLVLPVSEWPAQDRAMWEAMLSQGGPLDEQGALAHLRATSIQTLANRYGRWLRWLAVSAPEALELAPEQRATVARLQAWHSDLSHATAMSQLMFIDGILRILRAHSPDLDWCEQRRLLAVLKRRAGTGDRSRKLGRVLSSDVLLEAGLQRAGPEADCATTLLEKMKRQRDGTMIALLALLPMRRRSFNSLSLGASVHVTEEEIMISLSSDQTKTGVPWEAAASRQVEPLLRRYIQDVRPWLMARGNQHHDCLWVGKKGERISDNYLGSRIGTLTLQLTGQRVPPHFFRDAAATTLARLSPRSAKLIRPVLAHTGFGTAERHHIHATTIEAGRYYAEVINRLKRNPR